MNVDKKCAILDHLSTSSCKRSLWTTPNSFFGTKNLFSDVKELFSCPPKNKVSYNTLILWMGRSLSYELQLNLTIFFWVRIKQMSIHRVRYGGQNRPYWEPKCYQNNDGLAVEATAYALHTLFLMEGGGVTMLQGTICRSRTAVIRYLWPEFKFSAKIEMVFSQMLATSSWSNKLQ